MDDLVYERDASEVLRKRSAVFGWLSAEAVPYLSETDVDELEYFRAGALQEAWRRLRGLGIDPDPAIAAMSRLEEAIEEFSAIVGNGVGESEMSEAADTLGHAFSELEDALVEAMTQTEIPRESWQGSFAEEDESDDGDVTDEDDDRLWWYRLENPMVTRSHPVAHETCCDVLPELIHRFASRLRPCLLRARVVQDEHGVWLETSWSRDHGSVQIDRAPLEISHGGLGGEPIASRRHSAFSNALALIECDEAIFAKELGLLLAPGT